MAVNRHAILFYWDLGRDIVDKQENAKWGSGFINQLSKDLQNDFPEISGFSKYDMGMIFLTLTYRLIQHQTTFLT